AMQIAERIGTNPLARNVNFDWIEPARTMRIQIDQDQARQLGLSSQDVSAALNAVVSGGTVTQVRDSIYLIDVVTRAEQEQRTSLARARSVRCRRSASPSSRRPHDPARRFPPRAASPASPASRAEAPSCRARSGPASPPTPWAR